MTAFTTKSLLLKTPEVQYKDQSYIYEGCPNKTHSRTDLNEGVEAIIEPPSILRQASHLHTN
jgi:hypothetical protein